MNRVSEDIRVLQRALQDPRRPLNSGIDQLAGFDSVEMERRSRMQDRINTLNSLIERACLWNHDDRPSVMVLWEAEVHMDGVETLIRTAVISAT